MITQALGLTKTLNVHYASIDSQPSDILFCSSDGLHDALNLEILEEELKGYTDLQQCADDLVLKALELGSRDNVSVLLMAYHLPLYESLVHQVKSHFS